MTSSLTKTPRLLLALLCSSLLVLWAGAQEASLPRTGEICDSLSYDLDSDGSEPLTWVANLSGSPAQILAEVTSYRGEETYWGGTAQLKRNGREFEVSSWSVPLEPQL